ncbi:MAG: hypothetical protein KDA89_24775 [Planctomycetaceae bacterium]|nr:hypothetical protein [Planctomycetaceae bacterium]
MSGEHSIRHARDIVAKWASSDIFDRISALPEIPPIPSPHLNRRADSAAESATHTPATHTPATSESSVQKSSTVQPVSDVLPQREEHDEHSRHGELSGEKSDTTTGSLPDDRSGSETAEQAPIGDQEQSADRATQVPPTPQLTAPQSAAPQMAAASQLPDSQLPDSSQQTIPAAEVVAWKPVNITKTASPAVPQDTVPLEAVPRDAVPQTTDEPAANLNASAKSVSTAAADLPESGARPFVPRRLNPETPAQNSVRSESTTRSDPPTGVQPAGVRGNSATAASPQTQTSIAANPAAKKQTADTEHQPPPRAKSVTTTTAVRVTENVRRPAVSDAGNSNAGKDNSGNTDAGNSNSSSPAAAHHRDIRRSQVQRTPQSRPQHRRDRNQQTAAEGKPTVSRKLRVDSPTGGDQQYSDSPVANVSPGRIQSNSPKGGQRYRVDSGQTVSQTLQTGDHRARTQNHPHQRYIDEPHETAIRGPHFQVKAPRRSNLTSVTGQFLAYLGVLGLTIGTAMVIYGHFGGYSEYTPTGWLVTTVAQMMLFLGVINLVSGGIEQNNDDVSQRINSLGEQLMRIEYVTEQVLRGPHSSARHYADPNAAATEHEAQREQVTH